MHKIYLHYAFDVVILLRSFSRVALKSLGMVLTLYLVSLQSIPVNGQCNLLVNAGVDQSSCTLPGVFSLQGSVSDQLFPYSWSPAAGLSSTTILNPIATVNSQTTYVLTGTSIDVGGDLIVNGDFEGGNSGFTTDYTFNSNPSLTNELSEGQYTVGAAPAPMHRNWQACGDHTSGSGQMLIVNGATVAGQNAWCQTVVVMPNTDYAFSAWVVSVDPNGPVEIQFNINGSPVGAGNVGLSTTCVWTNFFVLWNSGNNTSIDICIEDVNTAVFGNDFAIDDIVFSPLCTVTDSITVTPSQVTAIASSTSPLCEGDLLTLNSSGGVVYSWNGPQNFTSSDAMPVIPFVSSVEAGTYSVTVTDANGCTGIASTNVSIGRDTTITNLGSTCDPIAAGTSSQTFINNSGCDSTVIDIITLIPSVTENISTTTCDSNQVGVTSITYTSASGCDSTVITTTTLIPSVTENISTTTCDSNQVGVTSITYTSASGCDSTVITTTTLIPPVTENISTTTCDSNQVGVTSITYTSASGCDSTVITTTTLIPSVTENISTTTCDSNQVGVTSITYTSASGCDSTVITTTTLIPSVTENVSVMTCDSNQVGVTSITYTSASGCDSTVITTTTLIPSVTENISVMTCDSNQVGVTSITYTSASGCDSTVITTTTLIPSVTENISTTTCDSNQVGVTSITYISASGCDSTVITTTTLIPSVTENISVMTCDSSEVGMTTEVFTSQLGCDSIVITTTSLSSPNSCYLIGSVENGTIPCDQSDGFLVFSISTGAPPFLYRYSGPTSGTGSVTIANQPTYIENLVAGDYTIEITDFDGKSITLFGNLSQLYSPEVSISSLLNLNGYDISCFGESDGQAEVQIQGGNAPYSIEWSTGDTTSRISSLSEGLYVVTVEDAENCRTSDSIRLTSPNEIEVEVVVNDLECFENSAGELRVFAQGGVGLYQYALNNSNPQMDSIFYGLTAGGYTLYVNDENGCGAQEILNVNSATAISVYLGEDFTIDFGDSTNINAFVSVPYDSLSQIIWGALDTLNCNLCHTVAVSPFATTTYSVTVVSNEGCSASDDLTILVAQPDIFAPTAFSPNGDGVNDGFTLFAKEEYVSRIQSLSIFDRWGDHLARMDNIQANDINSGWNGRSRGELLNPGVFVWVAVIELNNGTLATLTGELTLVR